MRNLLIGKNIKLTAVGDKDLQAVEKWFNDVYFLRFYDMVPAVPMGTGKVKSVIQYYDESESKFLFAIRDGETDKIIGLAGFDDVLWSNSTATIFVGIGEAAYLGRGLGEESMRLLLDFGFNELNLFRIQLNVISYNVKAIGMYEKLGFVREGVYRQLVKREGKRYDLYLYGLLKNEWSA